MPHDNHQAFHLQRRIIAISAKQTTPDVPLCASGVVSVLLQMQQPFISAFHMPRERPRECQEQPQDSLCCAHRQDALRCARLPVWCKTPRREPPSGTPAANSLPDMDSDLPIPSLHVSGGKITKSSSFTTTFGRFCQIFPQINYPQINYKCATAVKLTNSRYEPGPWSRQSDQLRAADYR